MVKQYTHLELKERTLIYWWRKEGLGFREIGRRLKRSHTTISRELRRNQWFTQGWFPRGAQKRYEVRLARRVRRFRLKNESIRRNVHQKLAIGWTPELIAGRLKTQSPAHYVCHESIYQYIYKIAPELIPCLARKHQKRRTKQPYRTKPERIKDRVSLALRPTEANDRSQCGHWESDSVIGSDRKHALNVLVDRKTRLTHITLLIAKTAEETKKAIINRLKNYPSAMKQSITYDNGTENTEHTLINKKLATQSYFCEPYHSWEKGTVEQTNGLIRRILPKGTDFSQLSTTEINRIEKLLNNRPRKCLNYKTPYEVARKERGALPG